MLPSATLKVQTTSTLTSLDPLSCQRATSWDHTCVTQGGQGESGVIKRRHSKIGMRDITSLFLETSHSHRSRKKRSNRKSQHVLTQKSWSAFADEECKTGWSDDGPYLCLGLCELCTGQQAIVMYFSFSKPPHFIATVYKPFTASQLLFKTGWHILSFNMWFIGWIPFIHSLML